MAKFCPFMSYQRTNYNLIYCDTECALWDEVNNCCSFKRVNPINSLVNKIPSMDELYPFGSETGTPYPRPYGSTMTAGDHDIL